MLAPKLFVSYCWSSQEHEQMVVDLATELRQSGVDVILDKWDLREGHDAIAFMEQMVSDPEIKKVLIICDEKYAQKADRRKGGVGTETQIISKEVYENQSQEKFVAVVTEKNSDGKPFLPTYYKSRIYIDFCDLNTYDQSFEQLLRWVFDKPRYQKPDLGNKPLFLEGENHISLGTTALFTRCLDALRNDKSIAQGAFDEYCVAFGENLEKFRIRKSENEFDEDIVKNIEEFLPYRNEILKLFGTIMQYAPKPDYSQRIHRFFESLIPYMYKPKDVSAWNDWDFDNFIFIIHELFLNTLAMMIKFERFELAGILLNQLYYCSEDYSNSKSSINSFSIFSKYIKSLEFRNERLKCGRTSLHADYLKKRCIGIGLDFYQLMQADFVAFLREEIETSKKMENKWWPETMIYSESLSKPFEIFAKATSKAYFEKMKTLLGITSPEELQPVIEGFENNFRIAPRWRYYSIHPRRFIGYEALCSRK